jgi:MFS family permease
LIPDHRYAASVVHVEQVQKRTVGTLMASNAFGYAGVTSVVAIVGLLAADVLGGDSWAGLPAAAATVGAALVATPLALRSRRRGRRSGLLLGYLLGAAGGVLALLAGYLGWFWPLVVAMTIFGAANAANLQSRFAAADLADDDRRARSIAMVVWVGTIGAVLGPVAALWANRVGIGLGFADWVSPILLGAVAFSVAGFIVWRLLRPDPLELAGGVNHDAPFENPLSGAARSWRAIRPNPMARLAIVVMAVSHMAMVAVMTMTPLHMRDHGQAELSTLVVAAHVLGMFGLSPLVGRWADRFGRLRMIPTGAAVLGAGTVIAVVAGYIPWLMFAGLFLLGLGWSFALISGSALLTESLPLEQRVGAQGLSDVMMSLLGAGAAFSSGFVKESAGFHWLANFATLAAIAMIFAATTATYRRPRTAS